MSETAQRHYIFRGRVQGVGFRWTTRRIAKGYPIVGYVRNLPDGTVEVVAEATPTVLDQFVAAIHDAFVDNISDCVASDCSERAEYSGFNISR